MTLAREIRKRPRRLRASILFGAVAVLLFAGYLAFLEYEDRRMATYYDELRAEKPHMYLEKLIKLEGFEPYVREFEEIHDYSEPHTVAPPFLVGRWRLFEEPKRVSARYFPESCLSGVEIEDGLVKLFGRFDGTYTAHYVMDGMQVAANLESDGEIPIDLVSYGAHLHHLEVRMPHRERTYYGYLCK